MTGWLAITGLDRLSISEGIFGRFVGDLEVRDVLYLMTIVMVFTCCIDLVESSPCHSYGTPLSSCCYESTEGDHAMRIMLSHGLILL